MMSLKTDSNLIVRSRALGGIVIQPRSYEESSGASLLVFPQPIRAEDLPAAVEWAASTQIPIFCRAEDLQRFEAEGIGSYRFQRLDGFKEVDYQGGTIEFFPARPPARTAIAKWIRDSLEFMGMARPSGFHVLIRPRGESATLFLSSPEIHGVEWKLFLKAKPNLIVGSQLHSPEVWSRFSQRMGVTVSSEGQIQSLQNQVPDVVTKPSAQVLSSG